MNMYPPLPDPPRVQTTELDWAEQARSDGWVLSDGLWQNSDRDDFFDDGDWIYLGAGAWEDAFLASLPQDARRAIVQKYSDLVAPTTDPAPADEPRQPGSPPHSDGEIP